MKPMIGAPLPSLPPWGDHGGPGRGGDQLPPPPPDDMYPMLDEGDERRPPRDDAEMEQMPPPFRFPHRLTLFDDKMQTVVGPATSGENLTLQAITLDNATVGWLGLRKADRPSDPLDIAFLRQQSEAFYMVGAFMLMLAAVVALLLSRHLLAPVQQLITGTRRLTSRRFDTRIDVKTSDELGQLAADFNQMAQTLQQYEQLRRQWLSDIAHELRTPLSVLQGEIEALQDGLRQASTVRLESLHAEVVHISKIVNDLHSLSLAESATLHFKRGPVNLITIVRACLQTFQVRFTQCGIVIADELGAAEDIIIAGDSDRLMQVLANLLENTLRYTDVPGMLTVSRHRTQDQVTLRFADTKPGVPPESVDRLFDRLYRVDPSRSRAMGGSGLGLAICKTIVEAHGGTISARNAACGGLQIDIMLPIEKKRR